MMGKETVSIILPVYNGENELDRSVKSVYAQTYGPIELLIINNGSTDDTAQKIAELEKQAPEHVTVRVINIEVNDGAVPARNLGIREATGTYIMFLDHDDMMNTMCCERCVETIEDKQADIVVCGFEHITDDGKILQRTVLSDSKWSAFMVMGPWAHLHRTEFLKKNNLYVKYFGRMIPDDIHFNIVVMSYTDKIVTIPYVGYRWMQRAGSVTNSWVGKTINEESDTVCLFEQIYQDVADDFRKDTCLEYFLARHIVWYMLHTFRNSKKRDIMSAYDGLMKWLNEHYPNYRQNPYIGLRRPKGEKWSAHTAVVCFYTLDRLHLMLPLLRVFGK